MARTFTIRSLADGQLDTLKTVLYRVPGDTQTIIKTITLVNTDTSTRTVNLYIRVNGTSRRIMPKDMPFGAAHLWINSDELTLEAADQIEGDASIANKIDYTINGIEES